MHQVISSDVCGPLTLDELQINTPLIRLLQSVMCVYELFCPLPAAPACTVENFIHHSFSLTCKCVCSSFTQVRSDLYSKVKQCHNFLISKCWPRNVMYLHSPLHSPIPKAERRLKSATVTLSPQRDKICSF